MEFYKDNLQILICNNVNGDKLIQISLGRNTNFQNKTKKDEKKLPTLTYKGDGNTIHFFGDVFVKNNKKRILLIKDNKLIKLRKSVKETNKTGNFQTKIKLKIMDHLLSMEKMFKKNLISVKYLSRIITNNVTNMSNLFSDCKSLESLPDISKWNTNNVTDINHLFNDCKSLKSLPDISKWNTNNVTNMGDLFSGCGILKSLPDISKWNTNKITNMSGLFSYCKSLKSLPDISKWNTNNVTNMHDLFFYC